MLVKNIIIFGGSGYIGSSLCQYFLKTQKKTKIFLLDIKKSKIKNKSQNIKYIKCDVRKKINLKFNKKIDLIINLAAIHREPGHLSEEYFDTNVYKFNVPRNVTLSEAPSHGLPAIIYDLKCSGSQAYIALAKEFLERSNTNGGK